MKILVSSHAFAPSIGGIETVSGLLAAEFVRRGHEVTIVTQTSDEDGNRFPFPVFRQPSFRELFRLVSRCDVFWQNNLSLRALWPAVLLRKPVVITHAGSYAREPKGLEILQRLKHFVVSHTTSVAISEFVAAAFKTNSIIIPNPYDARLFTDGSPVADRPGDLIFLGRLVTEKGLDILLESLGYLRAQGVSPHLTVVGSGPELATMQEMVTKLGLLDQVAFAGPKSDVALVEILRQHKILVIPSRYDEPFGVVALEGIACGCVAVGSSGGGLPGAIGPCGVTFPNGDARALAGILDRLLRQPNECSQLTAKAAQHLAKFHPAVIASAYLALFQSKLR